MPATDVAIISPEQLIADQPDCVLLTLPDLYDEVRERYPRLNGRWFIDPGPQDADLVEPV